MDQTHPASAQAGESIPKEKQAETNKHRILYHGQKFESYDRYNVLEHFPLPPLSRPVLTHVAAQDEYNLKERGISHLTL